MALVDTISIRATADTAQAAAGIARLGAALDKTAQSTEACTQSTKRNTTATKANTTETARNTKEHKKASTAVKHHASGLKRLSAALKRIVIYRALRGLIKSVTQAFAEGTKRMYEWSKAHDQIFMRVMDTYSTEFQYLKDALGAAVAPLLEALLPTIVKLIDGFVDLINVVNQFFRALAGYNTWFKVEKVAKQFQTDTENAAKAQKALNNQLMDFDQLNLITTPKDNGKANDETAPLSGNYVDIDPKILEAVAKFRQFIEPILSDIKEIWGYIRKFAEKLRPVIDLFLTLVAPIIQTIISGIKDIFRKLDESGAIDRFSEALRLALEKARPFFDAVEHVVGRLLDIIGDLLPKIIDAISLFLPSIGASLGAIGDIILGVFNLVEGLLDLLQGDFDGFFNHLGDAIVNLGHGILRLIKSILMALFSAIELVLKPFQAFDKWLYEQTGYSLSGKNELGYMMDDIKSQGGASTAIDDAFESIIKDIDNIGKKTEETNEKIAVSTSKTANSVIADWEKASKESRAKIEGAINGARAKLSETHKAVAAEITTNMQKTLAQLQTMMGDWAAKGSYWGSVFRKGVVDELKKLNNTQITMQPGQQGSWNNTKITMTAYAAGGFPDMGSMFVAGESGAEMVGTINGRTGVVSGDEISGIASAVYGTGAEEAALLRAILGAVQNKQLVISPSASLGKVVSQSNRLYAGVTG